MHSLVQDVRLALRKLRHQPAFTVTAMAVIGLGIGANTAIFSIVNAVLFRPLPYEEAERLVRVFTNEKSSDEPSSVSYPDFLDYRKLTTHLEGAAAVETAIYTLGTEDGAEAVMVEVMSANFFALTGLEPVLGRSYLPEEDEPGASAPVAIISHHAWVRRYGGDPGIIGRDIRLNGQSITIVGVGPDDFTGTLVGLTTEFWVPFGTAAALEPDRLESMTMRGARGLFVYARLRDHVEPEQTEAGFNVLATSLGTEYPETNADRTVTVIPVNDVRLHPIIDGFLYPIAALLMAVVGVVLLVACTNLANILLVRATSGAKEVAIRMALGSSRQRIVTQLLVESCLLGLLGGAVGLIIAVLVARLIVSFHPPLPVPIAIDLSLDRFVLLFALGLSLLTGIVFGMMPALRGSRPDLISTLKDNARSINVGGRRFGVRNILVVTQIILSTVLLVGAGLFVRSLRNAQMVHPGFRTDGVALATFDVSRAGYETWESGTTFFQQYAEHINALPGVTSVALAQRLPLGLSVATRSMSARDMDIPADGSMPEIDYLIVDDRFFQTMDIPVIRGRGFGATDSRDSPKVAVVTEALARAFWNSVDVVGEEIVLGHADNSRVVVGVTADIKVRTLGEAPRPLLYVPFAQQYTEMMTVLATTSRDPSTLVGAMREELRAMDPNIPMFEAKTIRQHLAVTMFAPQMGAALISAFGALAMTLAAIGLYGVIAVSVAQRTREVGVRLALGAARHDVIRLIMQQGLGLTGLGLVLGLVASTIVNRALTGFLIDVPSFDPVTYVAVSAVLLFVAAVASYVPARRAAGIEAQTALRYQ